MRKLREMFVKNFNMEMVAYDLLDLIEENKLKEYMISQFKKDFEYEELYTMFSNEMSEEYLKSLLEEMGYEY